MLVRAGVIVVTLLWSLIAVAQVETQQQSQRIIKAGKALVADLADSAQLRSLVSLQNKTWLTMDEVKRLDQSWVENNQPSNPLIAATLNSDISHLLQTKQKFMVRYVAEIIATNRQGLVVGASSISSDYNQADERKWQIAFKRKRVSVSDPSFDVSTGFYTIYIVQPMLDVEKNVLGMVMLSLKTNSLK